jgi:hypothetical protein
MVRRQGLGFSILTTDNPNPMMGTSQTAIKSLTITTALRVGRWSAARPDRSNEPSRSNKHP